MYLSTIICGMTPYPFNKVSLSDTCLVIFPSIVKEIINMLIKVIKELRKLQYVSQYATLAVESGTEMYRVLGRTTVQIGNSGVPGTLSERCVWKGESKEPVGPNPVSWLVGFLSAFHLHESPLFPFFFSPCTNLHFSPDVFTFRILRCFHSIESTP